MAKRKSIKGKTTIYKTYLYSKRSRYRSPTKERCELRCSRRVCRSWFISGTRRVNIVIPDTKSCMSKWPWSAFDKWNILVVIVTQIYHNGEPSHSGDRNIFEVMTSPLPKGTLDFSNFRVSSILYQGNPDRSHKHSNIVEWYILHMQVPLEWCYA
jgi:hypothetical protein